MLKLILYFVISVNLFASSCWSSKDSANSSFLELEGKMELSFKDDTTCKPVTNASVNISGTEFTTDDEGKIVFDKFDDSFNDYISLSATKEGYIKFRKNITVAFGSIWEKKFLLSKNMTPKSAKFVLSWSDRPDDLDLHLKTDSFHISYRNKVSDQSIVSLDRDSMNGFGPETITLKKIKKDKTYEVLVHNFSKNSSFGNYATLLIYYDNKLKVSKTINLAKDICLKVATFKLSKIQTKITSSNKCQWYLKDNKL